MKNYFLASIFFLLVFPCSVFLQQDLHDEIQFEVNKTAPYLSVSKDKLMEAHTLEDVNKYFKSSWVQKYIAVEVLTKNKGKINKAVHKSDVFSQEQKDNMRMADAGTDIAVKIQYMPDNTLSHNDAKEINFTFSVEPENEAEFPGGAQQLKKYLKEKAIDQIPGDSFKDFNLTAVNFTISEEGEIINAHIFESMYQTWKNEKVEKILLEAICNMPNWKPAEYADGTVIKQEFVLTVGDLRSCLIPLLNIVEN